MVHQVQFSIPLRSLARADVEFQVREDGIMLGTLMISRGSLVWFPANTRNGRNGLGEIRQIDGTRGDPDRAEIRHESLQKGRGGKPLLHILNGDASAAVLRQSNLEGHLLPRREALIDGPAHD